MRIKILKRELFWATAVMAITVPGSALAQALAIETTAAAEIAGTSTSNDDNNESNDLATKQSPASSDDETADDGNLIIVTGQASSFSNISISQEMINQQTALTSPSALIDNLPGVSVQEGDTFGFDDWSSTIAVRGFQINSDGQQIGITIDGIPNGGSNYGGGAKANRYIDTMNIGGVSVFQGTSDIASRSTDALGGTLDFQTADPEDEQRMRFSGSFGEFDAKRIYARYDSGGLFGDQVKAWISASHQEASDWITRTAENERDHIAAKLTVDLYPVNLTSYISYDDTHEDNYQRIFSAEQFANNPESDGLNGEWTGIPYIDQVYRKGWSTLRENLLAYIKADADIGENITINVGGYYHRNAGRGDWLPPYVNNVIDDGAGKPESELLGHSQNGGRPLGQILFVDANGIALAPAAGCTSSITSPYGGAGAEFDPACYPAGAIAVQSYRHTHYRKNRLGGSADVDWRTEFGAAENLLRGGLWYEDGTRNEWRDWHKLTDTNIGYQFDAQPYWIQYSRAFPQEIFKWYIEDQISLGGLTASIGVKQFLVNIEREDKFGVTDRLKVKSNSNLLLSGGLQWVTPLDGIELFAGYAENFKSLGDEQLERTDSDFANLKPETARDIDAGIRYNGRGISASATYFDIKFDDRVIFLSPGSTTGPDYLIGTNGTYFNGGGISSKGIEIAASAKLSDGLQAYASYTYTDATFLGTGDPLVDEQINVTPGNHVTGIPQNMYVLSLDWQKGPFRTGISGKYTGSRFVDTANEWKAASYFLADVYMGVNGEDISDSLKGVDLSMNINNVFDADYLGGISGGGAWIGAPRTVVFTMTADF